jgi:tetratricopeptide (TPR) repeat protein
VIADLQEGRVLLDRFVLHRCLRADPLSHLWFAQDLHLETRLLLQVYDSASLPERGVLESIKRDARNYRRLHHPHVARIHDLHEAGGLLLVSVDPREGELLSSELTRTGPLAHRTLIRMLRPLIEALVHLHENSGQHGRVDLQHVLVDGEARWILLPGDGTRPARGDMEQLGLLMGAVLTGGNAPEDGRQLNDVAERLHEGRTVPALLNQLVNDLAIDDAALRPAGMPDVLKRLDQLEAYLTLEREQERQAVAPAPRAGPPPAAETPPTAPTPDTSGARAVSGPRLRWLLVGAVLIIGVILSYPAVQHWRADRAPAAPDPAPVTPGSSAAPETPAIAEPPVASETPIASETPVTTAAPDEAKIAKEKLAAEEALGRYLAVRGQVDEIGAAAWGDAWGGASYEAAAAMAGAADDYFLDGRYPEAAAQYGEAATAFARVAAFRDEALQRLLREGDHALETPDAQRATGAFTNALLIEPENDRARIGLQRAATLDEVNRLLASGRAHEQEGRLAFAHADYGSAVQLDPYSEEAAAAYRGIKDRLADEQFQAMMSRGLEAYHRGDYDEARARLVEAQQLRPDAPEVGPALEMVKEARIRAEIMRLRDQALAHEHQERWQEAWNAYRQVLAIDPVVQFAQDGKTRVEEIIGLEKRMNHYLAHPDLLIRGGTREDATLLVQQLAELPDKGPRMLEAYAKLAEQVRLANTPLRVALESDEKTEVDVYRVGRYGTFKTMELELLPGVYTVIGRRKGYKDVRLTLRLQPGDKEAALLVICTERI